MNINLTRQLSTQNWKPIVLTPSLGRDHIAELCWNNPWAGDETRHISFYKRTKSPRKNIRCSQDAVCGASSRIVPHWPSNAKKAWECVLSFSGDRE